MLSLALTDITILNKGVIINTLALSDYTVTAHRRPHGKKDHAVVMDHPISSGCRDLLQTPIAYPKTGTGDIRLNTPGTYLIMMFEYVLVSNRHQAISNHHADSTGVIMCHESHITQHKNMARHTAHTIVSLPNPRQCLMFHNYDLMMIVRWNTNILTIMKKETWKLQGHTPIYCTNYDFENKLNLRHTLDRIHITGILSNVQCLQMPFLG